LEAFGFASLRDLPDLDLLKAEGLMQIGQGEDRLEQSEADGGGKQRIASPDLPVARAQADRGDRTMSNESCIDARRLSVD
jgi:hypothetical protein